MTEQLPPGSSYDDFRERTSAADQLLDEHMAVEALFANSLIAYTHAQEADLLYTPEVLVASGTWQKYEQRVAALARSNRNNDPFSAFLKKDRTQGWASVNTRQANRSALVRMAGQMIAEHAPIFWKEVLTLTDAGPARSALIDQLNGTVDADAMARMRAARESLNGTERNRLAQAVAFLIAMPPDPAHRALRRRQPKEDTNPKKKPIPAIAALRALNRHEYGKRKKNPAYCWRSHFWKTALTDDYVSAQRCAIIATLMLTGCRPVELSARLGVTVELGEANGENTLTFTVKGAKTAPELGPELEAKGQALRRIEMTCQSPESIWLRDYIAQSGSARLEIKEATTPRSPSGMWLSVAEQERRLTVSLGKLMTRLGARAFPRQRKNVTPYVFRHALAADMKADEKISDEIIAACLGQQSTRTLQHYGGSNRGRKLRSVRSQQIIRVTASSPIRGQKHVPFYDRGPVLGANQKKTAPTG
ncbi:site-specific integrase [Sulfitobacter sp. R18_1]|uniref:site-specific integrase n=1 Tax=Sulfitobacter sp. R18_1 TaxID=2821104 RepID=UPI001ADA15BE|nr:site-specific integrase [Sulfitobacter sp. R18_1]MBO9432533.1 site-specific integrase [Sulfitobacter sp. R18_1]